MVNKKRAFCFKSGKKEEQQRVTCIPVVTANESRSRNRIAIRLFLLFFCTHAAGVVAADLSKEQLFHKEAYTALNEIYNFRFSAADSIITKVKHDYPDAAGTYLLAANYYWWQTITGNDSKYNSANFLLYLDKAKASVAKARSKGVYSNEDLYSIISIYAFKARYEAMHASYIPAISAVNNCVGALKKSFGKEPAYEPFYLTSGLYKYMIFNTNENHPLLRPYTMFLPDGSKVEGLSMLEKTAKSKDPVLSTEANYFLFKIYFEQEKNGPKARMHISWLTDSYPTNLLYQYFYFSYLLKYGSIQEIKDKMTTVKVMCGANKEITEQQRSYFIGLMDKEFKKSNVKH